MPELPEDLDHPYELSDHFWKRLEEAVADRAAAWHLATFCTIAVDGSPSARSVILREVSANSRYVRFHTDKRSPKVSELACDPRATMLLWDPSARTQLRLRGRCEVSVNDAVTRSLVESSHPGSLGVFRSVLPPSSPIHSPGEALPAPAPLLENVAVVTLWVETLEWLWLDDAGHRRCRFTYAHGSTEVQWLAP